LNSIANMASRARVLHGDFPPSWDYLPTCGSVLRVAPNSAIQWSVQGHPKRLKLAFGVADPAPIAAVSTVPSSRSTLEAPRSTDIIFRVSAVGSQGVLVPLWSQRLDLPGDATSPNRQQAAVELDNAPSAELVLETLAADPTATDNRVCYWAAIELE
jgi:hypothetical protein